MLTFEESFKSWIASQSIEDEPEVEFAVEEDGAVHLDGSFHGLDGFFVVAEYEAGYGGAYFVRLFLSSFIQPHFFQKRDKPWLGT